ncbi:MAG: APC family permease [Chloroflexi bacterium]|nr:APC family permease [Chloroflexota bacterium]
MHDDQPDTPREGKRTPRVLTGPRLPHQRYTLQKVRSGRAGNPVYRVARPFKGFRRDGDGHLEATLDIERPTGRWGKLRRLLIGQPIHSELEVHERLTKRKALAVFSSDALSSVAYAPQETLLVLLGAGALAAWWSLPIAIAVVLLLAIVVTSYRQTIYTYPSGGGSYIVAKDNLGELPGLTAAAALAVGYILTVSVSIASAVDQLIAAATMLEPFRVWLGVCAISLITLANLRGIRESGNIFAVPTYVFLVAMYALIAGGLFYLFTGQLQVEHTEAPPVVEAFSFFLLLRAFAVGSAVMTGTEAISNGIPAFVRPEPRNAAITLVTMAAILGVMFLGLSVLIVGSGVVPTHEQTVVSLLGRAVFGEGPLYYLVQGSAVLILVLAANTAYADFPRLASLLAQDHYAPHQLAFRGERLAFSNGIMLLGILSALLIVVFSGSTGALLPLYALSVFAAFTFSQTGMVRHWLRERGSHWPLKTVVNGVGAVVTGLVALIAAGTNFMDADHPIVPGTPIGWGSWLVLVIVPAFIWMFRLVHAHYAEADRMVKLDGPPVEQTLKNVLVVPIARLNRPTLQALRYAQSLTAEVTAVHIASDAARADEIEESWQGWAPGVPLAIVESPYRSLARPLLHYLAELKRIEQADIVTVVLPEYIPRAWWQHILHGQSAQFLKLALLFKPGYVVVSVPYHNEIAPAPSDDAEPERPALIAPSPSEVPS